MTFAKIPLAICRQRRYLNILNRTLD